MSVPKEVSRFMARIGAKGGSARSRLKTAANRLNAQLPRKRKKKAA